MHTVRQQIVRLISVEPMTARQIGFTLGLTPKEIEAHLTHIVRSHRPHLRITPAKCIACGYTFKSRQRLNAPSRCPKCKAQRIAGPWFHLPS